MKLAIMGGAGRMGRMLIQTALAADGVTLSGVSARTGSDWVGRDVGEAMGGAPIGVAATDDALALFAEADGVIDFTTVDATLWHAELAAQARIPLVIGTTGFSDDQLAAIGRAARHAPIVRAGNMSLGVNLLTVLAEQVARALDESFDIEVVEAHHGRKVDAPSGTALMLGEAAARGRDVDLADVAARGRDGHTGPRRPGDIGFAVVRGGDVVGEHDVVFAGTGERVVLRHLATDRAIFARGAIKAALWARDKGPDQYDMVDVLGLSRPARAGESP